jgi:hypothetical protein
MRETEEVEKMAVGAGFYTGKPVTHLRLWQWDRLATSTSDFPCQYHSTKVQSHSVVKNRRCMLLAISSVVKTTIQTKTGTKKSG